MNSSCTDVAIGGIGKCRGACAGGLRSVVAATAQPAGTARKSGQDNGPGGELLALLRGFVFDGWFSAFRPVGQRRCKQRPNHCMKQSSSAVAATTEPSSARPRRMAIASFSFGHRGQDPCNNDCHEDDPSQKEDADPIFFPEAEPTFSLEPRVETMT